jgi:altronate hydrolase
MVRQFDSSAKVSDMRTQPKSIIILNESDNVAVAREAIQLGERIHDGSQSITAGEAIAPGHKIALKPIPSGARVLKYGEVIGRATSDISAGGWVHFHNLAAEFDSGREYEYATEGKQTEYLTPEESGTFLGYLRENGDVGTRNYIAVIATSNCASHVAQEIAHQAQALFADDEFIDGVVAIPHQEGCGHSQGDDTWQLERTIAGMIFHPNVGAVLMVSLGCEVNQIAKYLGSVQLGQQGFRKGKMIAGLEMQSSGGTRKTVAEGLSQLEILAGACRQMRRTPQPISKIVLGTNCGGSDAFSGISANPALGAASDLLIRAGGTSILAEIPECMGAEHILTRRALDVPTGQKVIDVIEWYRAYLGRFGAKWDDNPTPGNKLGGISNIAEKSLGAVAKGGTTALTGVYAYAERVNRPGFALMNTPGYDPVSLTGIAAGGANLICFTTGRGSAIGFPVVPVIKISSNTRIATVMEDNIDLNAGTIVEGRESVPETGRRIFEAIRRVASGERTRSEHLGHKEFVPWRIGPVM